MTFPFPTFCPVSGGIPLEFVDSATSKNSGQVTIPASADTGDFAILFDFAGAVFGAPSEVVPTGWTKIISASVAIPGSRIVVSHKTLGAGDPGASITGMTGSQDAKIVLVFKQPSSTPAASLWTAQCIAGDPAQQNVAASGVSAPLIVFGCCAATTTTTSPFSFSTASPAFDATVSVDVAGVSPGMTVGYKIYESAPQNHAIDINNFGATNALASGVISF